MSKMPDLDGTKQVIDSALNYALDFGEFILSELPNAQYTKSISEMRILQNRIKNTSSEFLTDGEIDHYISVIFKPFIFWNKAISKQCKKFYDLNAHLAEESTLKPYNEKYQPFKILLQYKEKFLRASEATTNVLTKYKNRLIEDQLDLFPIFYAIIAMTEALEYPFYENLESETKRLGVTNFDLKEIFSITTKWKNKKGEYQTDTRMIRNALSHFNFQFIDLKDDFKITFYPNPLGHEETRTFNANEFFHFVSDYKFLIQTFYSILCLMLSISAIRHFFIKKSNT